MKQERDDAYEVDLSTDPQVVDGAEISPTEDGGVIVDFDPESKLVNRSSGFHFENLAELLDNNDTILSSLTSNLIQAITNDYDSAEEWRGILQLGIDQLGFKEIVTNWPFEGSSTVYSASYARSVMTFVATACSELLPPGGPVDIKINGKLNPEIEDSGQRQKLFFNYYLTEVYKEFYPETEKAILWSVIAGAAFKKTYQDPTSDMPRPLSPCIRPDELIVNFGATNLSDCSRITHVFYLTKKEIKLRQMNGLYKNIKLNATNSATNSDSIIDEAIENIVGIHSVDFESNHRYKLYECHADLDLKGLEHVDEAGKPTGIPLPYIVTIDADNRNILSIYRNWYEGDPEYKRIEYFTKYPNMPGFGIYGFGMAHIAAGSAKASTALKRQMMDSGTLASFPGGLIAKGMRIDTNNLLIGPTEFRPIDTGGLPIDQAVMMLPYRDPSPVLKELYDAIESEIAQIAAINDLKVADFNQNAPVGTTLALLEQANRLQSSVMKRLHSALAHEFQLMYKIFAEYLPENGEYPFAMPGTEAVMMKQDFSENINIIPVSDPNNNSYAQRLIQAEALVSTAKENPDLFDMRAVIYRKLKILNIQDIDEILPNKDDGTHKPVPLDPITENQNVMLGMPVVAGLDQDQDAHIATHTSFRDSSFDPQQDGNKIGAMNAHIAQHQSFKYLIEMQQSMGMQMPQDPMQIPMEVQNQIAMKAAQVAAQKQAQAAQTETPPLTPEQVMMEDVKVKAQAIAQRAESDRLRNEMEIYKTEIKAEVDRLKAQLQYEIKSRELETKAGVLMRPIDNIMLQE